MSHLFQDSHAKIMQCSQQILAAPPSNSYLRPHTYNWFVAGLVLDVQSIVWFVPLDLCIYNLQHHRNLDGD